MSDKTFVFLGGQDILKGLFDSHNISFLENLYKYEIIDFNEVIFSFICKRKLTEKESEIITYKKNRLLDIAKNYNFKIVFYQISKRSSNNAFKAAKEISQLLIFKKSTPYLWCHNYFNGFIGLLIKKKIKHSHLHLDIKGLPPQEELFYGDSILITRIVKSLSSKLLGDLVVTSADSVSVVSERFKKYIISKYHLKKEIMVYPSVFDSSLFRYNNKTRNLMRKQNKIEHNQLVVFYSGSLQKWQSPDSIFKFFKNIELQDVNGKIIKYVLTNDIVYAKQLSKKYKIASLRIISLRGQELVDYLIMGDIGIICRKNDLVNRVASPTKIAEYIATKNCVVLTESVGDYGLILKNKNFSIVCKGIDDFVNLNLNSLYSLKKPDTAYMGSFKKDYSSDKIAVFKKLFK